MKNVHFSSHFPKDQINYRSISFTNSEVELQDNALTKFIPSMTQFHRFLKFGTFDKQAKAFGSDGMNNYGKRVDADADDEFTDMLEYWNFYLESEMFTFSRQRYTWLDNIALIGGLVEFFLVSLTCFFWIYNYEIATYKLFYSHKKNEQLQAFNNKRGSCRIQKLERNHLCIGPILLIMDIG